MAEDAALAQLTAALLRAEEEGYRRATVEHRAALVGLDAAGLIAGAYADAMEQTASRLVQVDAAFAERLRVFAGNLRGLVTPPTVTAYEPRAGAKVPITQNVVSATFDREMDAASVTLDVQRAAGGTPLKGAVTYDHGSRTVSMTLDHGLKPAVPYRATVAGSSAEGYKLEPVSWEFTAVPA